MRGVLYTLYIFGLIDYTLTQYHSIGAKKNQAPANLCDSSQTALVENFFNIIFNEFHNTPPVCVCVQMCPDQPTYCYPNGCLRRSADRLKVRDSANPRDSEKAKPLMLFVDDNSNFVGDLMENRVDESKLLKTEKTFIKKLRPDPFKDRYKMLFKYKKSPRVELRYHHGEQVKSDKMKQESIDVSNTRWPSNKNRRSNKRTYLDSQDDGATSNAKFHKRLFKDNKTPTYPSKYFKRDLRNMTEENDEQNDSVNIQTIYVLGKTDVENSSFSLDALIDDIIEKSFDYKSTTVDTVDHIKDNQTVNSDQVETVVEENVTIVDNESMHIISINLTNETVDKNKYIEDDDKQNNTETNSDMILTLSKKIEMQNNTSLEMMRRVVGTEEDDVTVTTYDNIDDTTQGLTIPPSFDYEILVTKKNKQRIARKLQNGKFN